MKITDFSRQLLTETLHCLVEYAYSDGLGGRDATVIATLNSQNIKKVISHDAVFKRLASKVSLDVIDPILR